MITQRPRAAVRITITSRMLEQPGQYLNEWGLRQIRQALLGIPERAPITIDLGWHGPDYRLINELAHHAPTNQVAFESASWSAALEAAERLHAVINDDSEAWAALAKFDPWRVA